MFFSPPSSPLIIIISSSSSSSSIVVVLSPLNSQFSVMGAWVGAGFVARLRVGWAFKVFLLPGLGVGGSSHQVPRHPTSMCDSGVKL